MENKETSADKKKWHKTWWGILVLLLFWPFSLTYWIWKKDWPKQAKYISIGLLWVIVLVVVLSNQNEKTVQDTNTINKSTIETTPTSVSVDIQTSQDSSPTLTPYPSVTVTSKPYNKLYGNNATAAEFAEGMQDLAESATPGIVDSVFLELSPEDLNGKTEEEYKQNIISAFLTVEVDNTFWASLDDSTKKDLVATFVNSVKNSFSGFPHIYINNGIRTVAEGSWSVFNGETSVELK